MRKIPIQSLFLRPLIACDDAIWKFSLKISISLSNAQNSDRFSYWWRHHIFDYYLILILCFYFRHSKNICFLNEGQAKLRIWTWNMLPRWNARARSCTIMTVLKVSSFNEYLKFQRTIQSLVTASSREMVSGDGDAKAVQPIKPMSHHCP